MTYYATFGALTMSAKTPAMPGFSFFVDFSRFLGMMNMESIEAGTDFRHKHYIHSHEIS